jgi:fatty acyl-CoA reductase
LAKSCKNLTSIIYISTCYTNAPRFGTEIREKVYPINFDPYEVIKQVNGMTYEEADKATTHTIREHPNTYTFSKMIAEHIILEEKENLPLAIIRPSIIGGAFRFPVPGWVDSPIGASGLIAAASLGVLHCMNGRGSNIVDFVPVDFVADQILASAWSIAENPGDRVPIYHASSSFRNPYYWEHLRSAVVGYYRRRPPKKKHVPRLVSINPAAAGILCLSLFFYATSGHTERYFPYNERQTSQNDRKIQNAHESLYITFLLYFTFLDICQS